MITFSITTCKRLNLFKKSVNSFINSCEDLNLISQWLCVDDNSSEEDRKEMVELYPFFHFIFKNKEKKGHAKSMNISIENVKNKYIFQMEDDWLFLQKSNYMSRCLDILNENEKYGQVVINRNYAEIADSEHLKIAGGFRKVTKNKTKYVLHEHYQRASKEESDFFQRNENRKSSCYWPHFSLNPSLIKTNAIKEVGSFSETAPHFEMEFAFRYVNAGYSTCFLDGIHISHIGRSLADRGNLNTKNAYDLNETKQF